MEDCPRVVKLSQLQPFKHQVAGHSVMYRYGSDKICKLVVPQELEFYETMPHVLKPFIPAYGGLVIVDMENPEENSNLGSFKKRLEKGQKTAPQDSTYQFMLLENIVAGYKKPSVIDLKMGFQHYRPSSSHNTTSASLGVRLCGMKMHRPKTGEYIHLDKVIGRNMKEQEFRHTIQNFLFDGQNIRRDLIPTILTILKKLKAVVCKLPSYRFDSSSLLIVYESAEQQCDENKENSSSCVSACRLPQLTCCSDNTLCNNRKNSCETTAHRLRNDKQNHVLLPLSNNTELLRHKPTTISQPSCSPFTESTTKPPVSQSKVDVRLVDFGRSTRSHVSESGEISQKPDEYFLLGLQTLIDIMEQM